MGLQGLVVELTQTLTKMAALILDTDNVAKRRRTQETNPVLELNQRKEHSSTLERSRASIVLQACAATWHVQAHSREPESAPSVDQADSFGRLSMVHPIHKEGRLIAEWRSMCSSLQRLMPKEAETQRARQVIWTSPLQSRCRWRTARTPQADQNQSQLSACTPKP